MTMTRRFAAVLALVAALLLVEQGTAIVAHAATHTYTVTKAVPAGGAVVTTDKLYHDGGKLTVTRTVNCTANAQGNRPDSVLVATWRVVSGRNGPVHDHLHNHYAKCGTTLGYAVGSVTEADTLYWRLQVKGSGSATVKLIAQVS